MSRKPYIPITRSGSSILASIGTQIMMGDRRPKHHAPPDLSGSITFIGSWITLFWLFSTKISEFWWWTVFGLLLIVNVVQFIRAKIADEDFNHLPLYTLKEEENNKKKLFTLF